MSRNVQRRDFLRFAGATGALALLGANRSLANGEKTKVGPDPREHTSYPNFKDLVPIRASQDRVVRETVGLRPFRETGPNLSVETIGKKTVVHNYGHGGSGWSLSWGTAIEASEKALATGADSFAVIGCGAVGMTTAVMLLRAGKKVTIYSKDRHPNITSSVATGVWSPDSRICLEEHGSEAFAQWWSKTCRASFGMYQTYLGLPGNPIEWVDTYAVSDKPWDVLKEEQEANHEGPRFGHFKDYVRDLTPRSRDLEASEHPFAEPYVKKGSRMIFNISAYTATLLGEIRALGGTLVTREFHEVSELASLSEKTLINATGLGAKTLFKDDKMVSVRGQLTFLIPDPSIQYQFSNPDAYVIPRRDGLVVGSSDNGRYGSTDTAVDAKQSYDAVEALARSMKGFHLGNG
ncbi:FAD-dependent oxidoreductase [Pelagicoccus sp. SDUM812003]|uniref:FAD-dependent oxidoreductase n=1 Tax=Pelagicoccus sp. SDUM812003 TaxID=3041267 RepID=UPI00280FBA88|nr:FAD-dependent oxidoreductase [Pelagicoccus sp. SDUM812003]MDQ8204040.1 FAD-dependent oxidoreductase [Pelagicoccus sp. SDUM812003]